MKKLKKIFYKFFLPYEKNAKVENCYITCAGRNDGLGAQVQAILSTILLAKQYNLTYVHTPFKILDHNPGEEKYFETFFNFAMNEKTIDNISNLKLKINEFKHSYEIKKEPHTLYIGQSCHDYADRYPNTYLNIQKMIIDKFLLSSKKDYPVYYENNKVNIALHIRRGDVSQQQNEARFTENFYYKSILEQLLDMTTKLNYDVSIHLYSQGKIEDFSELKDFNINYHLNECLATTFYNLTLADILVMSKSSLSYSAALLSKNIKIYQEFWHKPLNEWVQVKVMNSQVLIDEKKLEEKIKYYKD